MDPSNFLLLNKLYWPFRMNYRKENVLLLTGKKPNADFLSHWQNVLL